MIISFWSPGGNTGKSILALVLAKVLGQKGNKVMLLDLNLKSPSQAIYHNDSRNCSIDDILCYLVYDDIEKVISSNTASFDDHDVVYGTKAPEKCLYVKHEPVMNLIDHIASMYTHTVIDTCSDIDNAGTYCALTKADIIAIVLNQNIKDIMLLQKNEVFHSLTKDKRKIYLVNGYRKELNLTVDEIKDILGIDDELYVLPVFSNRILDVINSKAFNGIPLDDREMKPFAEIMDEIIFGPKETPGVAKEKEKKRGFLSKLFAFFPQRPS